MERNIGKLKILKRFKNQHQSIKDNKILKHQKDLEVFYNSEKRHFSFKLDCHYSQRVKFIYSVIFPGREKYKFYLRFFIARVAQYVDFSILKVFLYRLIGVKVGKGVFISPDCFIDPHFPWLIELKDYCILGWGVKLFGHEANLDKYRLGRITIGEGALIGAYSVVRSGVCIGDMAQIAYGSSIYKNVAKGEKVRLNENIICRADTAIKE